MCRVNWLAASAAIFLLPASALCQQQGQAAAQGQSQDQTQTQQAQTPATQQDSLAAAARRAREQKKDAPKPAKIFDNDNLPAKGGISTVGSESEVPAGDNAATAAAPASSSSNDERSWRDRFAKLRHKLEQDQAELDVMQREAGVLDLQYYNDPVKAMQQQLTRSDINKKNASIEDTKKKIEADKQAISDAEDDLRRSGGDSGWAR